MGLPSPEAWALGLTRCHPGHMLGGHTESRPRFQGWGSPPLLLIAVAATYCGHGFPASPGSLTSRGGWGGPTAPREGHRCHLPALGRLPHGEMSVMCVHGRWACDQERGRWRRGLMDVLIHSVSTYF